MAGVGVTVLEKTRAVHHCVVDLRARQQRAYGLIAGAQALAYANEVGRHALLLTGIERAAAAHAAHYFVEDQQYTVLVADCAHALEIARHRGNAPQRGPAYGFGDKGDDPVRSQALHFRFQLAYQAPAVGVVALAFLFPAISVTGRNMRNLDQQGLELLAPPQVAASSERAQGIAVVTLPACDYMVALWLANFNEILAREL